MDLATDVVRGGGHTEGVLSRQAEDGCGKDCESATNGVAGRKAGSGQSSGYGTDRRGLAPRHTTLRDSTAHLGRTGNGTNCLHGSGGDRESLVQGSGGLIAAR